MSESAQSRRPNLAVLAMAGTLITLVAALGTIVWSSVDGGEAGLSDALIGSIPTAIVAIASTLIASFARQSDNRPRWMAVTAFWISGVIALPSGYAALLALLPAASFPSP
ncbi:hypothetical protein ACPPVQ_05870 [Diaminobutyricibacter sp. McL0618]|uniref:hypothetical protein n=1 Tax=Leifsonia sp. McL0618 TaxID=3415677 RepID=UPI003CEBAAD6